MYNPKCLGVLVSRSENPRLKHSFQCAHGGENLDRPDLKETPSMRGTRSLMGEGSKVANPCGTLPFLDFLGAVLVSDSKRMKD